MPAAGTRSASSDDDLAWVVPERLRVRLAERYGPVYAGAEADRQLAALTEFSSCGDRVASDALRLGRIPFIAIVDRKTLRNEPIDPAPFERVAQRQRRRVVNPPGMLTGRLRAAVEELVRSGGGLIEVEGEEDLGSLALVESLPAGATVIYGIPGAGVSFVPVDAAAKAHVKQLIAEMEPRRLELGR
jgi:uncharacterized protein (UPF0218 family)